MVVLFVNKNNIMFPILQNQSENTWMNENGNFIMEKNPKDDMITIFFPGRMMYPYMESTKNLIIVNYRPKHPKKGVVGYGNIQLARKNGLLAYRTANKKYKQIRIVVFSIGNAVFSEVLKDIYREKLKNPIEIINIAGMLDMKDFITHYFGFFGFPIHYFFHDYRIQKNLKNYLQSPYIMIYSTHDDIIPYSMAKKLYFSLQNHGKQVFLNTLIGVRHSEFDVKKYIFTPLISNPSKEKNY